ncbi:MAG: hypothetical protein ACLQQ4_15925 [Bacteroidia bacterium]
MKNITYCTALASLMLLASCAKKDSTPSSTTTNTNNNNNTITVNSTPQFTGTINGTAYSLVAGSVYSSGVSSGKQIGGTGATNNYEESMSMIGNATTNQPYLTINKGTITFPLSSSMPDTVTFFKFFTPGSYPYSVNYTNGIEVDWIDPSGNSYSTSLGAGTQTGSTFTITAEKAVDLLGTYNVVVVINFSCTLYNSSGSGIKLTNGVYVGAFQDM